MGRPRVAVGTPYRKRRGGREYGAYYVRVGDKHVCSGVTPEPRESLAAARKRALQAVEEKLRPRAVALESPVELPPAEPPSVPCLLGGPSHPSSESEDPASTDNPTPPPCSSADNAARAAAAWGTAPPDPPPVSLPATVTAPPPPSTISQQTAGVVRARLARRVVVWLLEAGIRWRGREPGQLDPEEESDIELALSEILGGGQLPITKWGRLFYAAIGAGVGMWAAGTPLPKKAAADNPDSSADE